MSDERSITARFTADTSGFSPKVNELIQHLKSLNSEYAANEQEIKRLNTEMKSYQKELQALEQKQRSGQTLTERETAQMQSLRDSIARCATELGTYRSAQSTLRSDINQTSRELNEQRDAMNGVSDAAASFGDVLKANIISDAIHTGLQKTLELLKSAAAYCYDVGTSFESAMSQVEAISGASGSQLEALTNKAKQLGSSTKFTATQAAEAMNYMAMAGWDANQMLSGIDGVLSLAAASGEDLGTTSDIVTDALTAFGLKAKDVSHFSNVLAAAAANANTNVALMGETFKYCAADAGSFGFTAEDTVTAIGLMASAGIKGSQAGTALRRLFNEMSGDLKITSKEFGEIAIKTANADGTMRPFIDIIRDLRTEFSKLKPQEMSAVAEQLVGKNAQTGFKTLMNASEEDFKKLTEAIENCDGAAANMAETMQDNLAGKVTILESALEGLGISVYDKFGGALRDVVDIFTDCISDMTDSVEGGELNESISHLADSFHSAAVEIADLVSDNLPGFIDGIAKTLDFVITFRKEIASAVKGFIAFKATMAGLMAIKSLVGLFTSLTAAIKAAGGAQQALNAVMAANPFGVIATAVSVLVIGISEFTAHTKKATESADDLREKSEQLKQSAEEYKQKAGDLSDIKEQYEEIYNAIDPDIDRSQALKDLQDQLIQQFPELAGKIDLVNGSYAAMCGELQNVIDKTTEAYKISAKGNMLSLEKRERDFATELDLTVRDITSGFFVDLDRYASSLKTYKLIDGKVTFEGAYEDRLADMITLNDWIDKTFGDYAADSKFFISLSQQIGEVEALKEELESARAEYYGLNDKKIAPDFSGVDDRGIPWSAYIDPNDRSKGFKSYAAAVEESADKIKSSLDDVKSAYKSTLDAIDAELEKHNRNKQDKEYQSRVDALTARLKYEQLDDFSRIALEKQLADVREQWNEAKYKRNIADKKALLNTVYTQAQSAADYVPQESINQWSSTISSAIEQIGGTAGSVSSAAKSESAVYNIVVNAQTKTTDQIVREVTAAISKRAV